MAADIFAGSAIALRSREVPDISPHEAGVQLAEGEFSLVFLPETIASFTPPEGKGYWSKPGTGMLPHALHLGLGALLSGDERQAFEHLHRCETYKKETQEKS